MRLLAGLVTLLAFPICAHSAPSSVAATEISHLLQFVETSNCVFTRNGKNYDSRKATAHLKGKLDYADGRIETAEQFIDYAASKSSMTGKPYTVQCNAEKARMSKDWLNEELAHFRKLQKLPNKSAGAG